jgi:hypothetical protein
MNFKDVLIRYKVLFYHFLDGFINSDDGYNNEKVISFIQENKLVKNHINIINSYRYDSDESGYILYLINLSNIENKHLREKNIIIQEYKRVFNFCIININLDKHSTSIVIFIKNDKLYLLSVNSGDGIELHDKLDEYYKPYSDIIILCENITTDSLFIDAIHKIYSIIYLIELHVYLNEQNKDLNDDYFKFYDKINYYEKINASFNVSELEIVNVNNKIYKFKDILELKTNKIKICKKPIFLYKRYYDFFIKFINLIANDNEITFSAIVDLTKYINTTDLNVFLNDSINIKVNNRVIEKTIYKFTLTDLYILPQESGSCTWFAMYWPIIMYPIIMYPTMPDNHNYMLYVNNILHINYTCYKLIQDIFTNENIYNQLNYDYDYYVYMKILCDKFINLNILSPRIIEQHTDFIYNYTHNFKYDKYEIIKSTDNLLFSYVDIQLEDDIILSIYKLCKQDSNSKNQEASQTSINNLINIILKLYFFKKNCNYGETFFVTKEPEIPEEIDIDNNNWLFKLLIEFKETYNYNNNKYPSEIISYIPIVLYIDKCFKLNKFNLDNKEELFKFILFYNRFLLFYRILYLFSSVISNRANNYPDYVQYVNKILNLKFTTYKKNYEYILPADNFLFYRIVNYDNYNSKYSNIFSNTKEFNFYVLRKFFINQNYIIDNYEKFKIFLYKNPKYITNNANNTKLYNLSKAVNFIKIHIFDIFNNEEYRDNLLRYYLYQWSFMFNNKLTEIDNLLKILEVLLFKTRTEPYLKDYLIDIEKKEKFNFSDYIIKNKDNLIINRTEYLIKKSNLINYNITNNEGEDFITIDNDIYKFININKTILNSIFNINHNCYYLINNKYFINKDQNIEIPIDGLEIELYKLDDNYNIKFICNFIDYDNYIIKEIFYNDNKVIKYDDIIYPFKYIIPKNCFHMIYLNNNVYNIAFINNYSYDDKSDEKLYSLLVDNIFEKNIYNFKINSNTQFYIENTDNIKYFQILCSFYQINKYNILYIDFSELIENDKKHYLFYYNMYNIMDYDPSTIFISKIDTNNDLKYNNYNILNYNNQNSDLNIDLSYDKKKLINYLISNNDKSNLIFKSYQRLLYKISHFQLNIENVKGIQDKLKNIQQNITDQIKTYLEIIYNFNFKELLLHYNNLYNYLLSIKVNNFINKLLSKLEMCIENFDDQINLDNLYSLIKINNELFNTKKKMFQYNF